MIKQRTVYTHDGQDFNSLAELKGHIENKIGENVIDLMDNELNVNEKLTPKQKLKILEVLAHPTARKQLNKLLNATYTETETLIDSSDCYQGETETTHNILDYK